MTVRPKRAPRAIRRRQAQTGHGGARPVGHPEAPSVPRRRQGGAPQDHAVYACECGLVFEAPVSTSVRCPHCGTTQAW